ncbi:MAG: hypothetical protein KBS97_00980 [Firmicutes bacterium]|nr:hypothetical protein [Candidatus Fiminaster equi]
MGYKIGFLLSLILLVELFILAGDIFSSQVIFTNLDAASVTAGNIISSKGGITEEVISFVKNNTGGEITAVGDEAPLFGSIFTFKISKEFKPMNFFTDEREISVTRSVIIGYYN